MPCRHCAILTIRDNSGAASTARSNALRSPANCDRTRAQFDASNGRAGRTLCCIAKGTREVAMDWSSSLSWLVALRRVRRARDDPADRAGMGTAFGLDASIVPIEDWTQAAAQNPPCPTPAPWERRLVRRSGL
jgi:hypothetical protein